MLQNITSTILTCVQPIALLAFLVAGICCLILKQWSFTIINLGLFVVNTFVFYGSKIFK